MVTRPWRLTLVLGVAALAVCALVYYAWADPQTTPMPQCVFRRLTGWQCPGCGSQRALHALLHGRVAEAWSYNRLLPFLIALAVAYATGTLWRGSLPRLWRLLNHHYTILAIAAAVIAFTVGRNLV